MAEGSLLDCPQSGYNKRLSLPFKVLAALLCNQAFTRLLYSFSSLLRFLRGPSRVVLSR